MIKYAWSSLKNTKVSSVLFIIAIIAILTVSTISLQSVYSIQVQVDDDIKNYARGSYDILLRPSDAQSTVEKKLGVVEENYLGAGNGGITIEQWEQIKAMKDIEIAAPVASLGYFTGFSRTVEFPFPESSSLFTASFYTSDGIQEYKFGNDQETFYLEQENYYGGYETIKNLKLNETIASGEKPNFLIPQTFHLVMGIDFEQETKLTDIPFDQLNSKLSYEQQTYMSFAKDAPNIKIFYLSDPKVSVKIQLNQIRIPWESKDTLTLKNKWGISIEDSFYNLNKEEQNQILRDLHTLDSISSTTYTFDLSQNITPFYFQPFSLDYNGNVGTPEIYATSIGESSQFYSTSSVDYQIQDGVLSVKQIGKEYEVPVYRQIKKIGKPAYEATTIPFVLVPVDSFSAKEYQNELAGSPLGIYNQAPTTTKDGTVVHETAVPGSFISSPAHGLIDIHDTVYIKGDQPIDAIRIKVAGITLYDEQAQNKILDVVEQLHQLGNFQIDIVAGASPKTMQMDVEGIGMVSQQWTGLGAATKITEGWNLSNTMISGLFILAGLFYILNRIFFWKNRKQSEASLLSDLGWSNKHINTFHILELIILGVIASGISFSIIGICIYTQLLEPYSLFIFVIVLLLFFLFIFINGIKPIKFKLTIKQGAPGRSLFIRNLYYYRKFIILTFVQLSVVTILLYFVIGSIFATTEMTGDTNLGSFINNNIYFSLIMIIIVSACLALITVAESNTSFLTLRQNEIHLLGDVGWRRRDIQFLCMKETATWTACSILLGALLGFSLLMIVFDYTFVIVIMALLITLGLYGLVLIVSYFVIARQLHPKRGMVK